MRRLVWRILLAALVLAALTGTALAADTVTLDNGIMLEADGSSWKVTGYTGTDTRLVIPSTYDGKPITAIDEAAFKNANGKKITEVIIPGSVTLIGDSAFDSCTDLQTVVFMEPEKNNTGVVIGEKAFINCARLKNLVLSEKLKTIGTSAFSMTTSLTKVAIPDNVTEIQETAFAHSGLKTVYIPQALKNSSQKPPISETAFSDTALESIHYGGPNGTKAEVYTIFAALPPGIDGQKIHLAVYDSVIAEPTCTEAGRVMGGANCKETTGKTDVCESLIEKIDIAALGHDYQEPQSEYEEEAKNHAACTTWVWEFESTCSRCGEAVKGSKTIAATADHEIEISNEIVIPATCKDTGLRTWTETCKNCGETWDKQEVLPKSDVHTYLALDTVDLGDPDAAAYLKEYLLKPMTCTEDGLVGYRRLCTVCGQLEPCEVCDNHGEEPEDHWSSESHITKVIPKDPDDASAHPADRVEVKEVVINVENCEEGGTKETTYYCTDCDTEYTLTESVPSAQHTPTTPDEVVTPATCDTPGQTIRHAATCEVCGAELQAEETTITPALGHDWGNFVETGRITEPTCAPGEAVGTATCQRDGCGAVTTDLHVILEPVEEHAWSDWTPDEAGSEESRTCGVCGKVETRSASAAPGETPSEPEDPDDPDSPSDPDTPSTPSTPSTPDPTSYSVDLIQSTNGSISSSRSTAEAGDRVTLTVWANSNYELDQIRVTTAGGSVVSLTNLGGGQYRFTMPSSKVEVRASFVRKYYSGSSGSSSSSSSSSQGSSQAAAQTVIQSVPKVSASSQLFSDIPVSYWAAGEINWANQMGYMNGSGGGFNPDGNITHQQLWMVLARLTGSRPANMEEARRWAVNGGFAEGSSPTGAVSRHQLVTALYRCAHLMGSTNRNTTTLAGYTDSRTVPASARDAFAWAVANGIISGNASGRLDPNGTLTRAQFAVILYRYSQRI